MKSDLAMALDYIKQLLDDGKIDMDIYRSLYMRFEDVDRMAFITGKRNLMEEIQGKCDLQQYYDRGAV